MRRLIPRIRILSVQPDLLNITVINTRHFEAETWNFFSKEAFGASSVFSLGRGFWPLLA